MRHLANGGHGTVAAVPQGFKGDGPKRGENTAVVPAAFLQRFLVLAKCSATSLSGGAMHIAGSKRMDEGDIA
jgi:hypothetical protein